METNFDEKKKPKASPIVAGIFGLLCPGLGHIYTNRLKSGLIIIGIIVSAFLACVYLGLLWHYWGLVVFYLMYISAWIISLVDAVRRARKRTARPFNALSVIAIGIMIWLLSKNASSFSLTPCKVFIMRSNGMAPTIEAGDYIISDKSFYKKHPVERLSLVIYHEPHLKKIIQMRRVAAVGGDTVEIRNDSLFINSGYVPEPDDYFDTALITSSIIRNFPKHVVGPGSIFLLGDNRFNCFDSRNFGNVSKELIIGKPLYIYRSRQWDRIGKQLK